MKFNAKTIVKIVVISAVTTVALSHLSAARQGH